MGCFFSIFAMRLCITASVLALSRQPTHLAPLHIFYEMEQVMAGEQDRQRVATLRLCRLKFGPRPPFYAALRAVEDNPELRIRFAILSRSECQALRPTL